MIYIKMHQLAQKNFFEHFTQIFTTNYDYNIENILGRTDSVCHLHGEFNQLSPKYNVNSIYYTNHKAECDNLIAKKSHRHGSCL